VKRDIIVGSGPAGLAAATALVSHGRRVTILDVGEQIEPERAALRSRMGSVEPDQWDPVDVAMAREPGRTGQSEGIRPFGSDVLFRDPVGFAASNIGQNSVGLKPSFATGGMSNGWGAAVLPYRIEDITTWPIGEEELSPHYNALRSFVPIASQADALAELFPMLNVPDDTSLPLSSQGAQLLHRFDGCREQLKTRGVYYGKARQAVTNECRACTMCLCGCPYGLIFNASHAIERLSRTGDIDYRRGQYVLRFEEHESGVRVWSRDLSSGTHTEHAGERVFIAAGVLSTAKIVLNSLGKIGDAILMSDSQHFFLPTLQSWWPRPNPAKEARHTLAQLFVEILDPAVSEHAVHFQLYTHNDSYAADMRTRFGLFAGPLKPAITHVSRRLVVAQGFLHSDDSAQIEIRLVEQGNEARLAIKPIVNPRTDSAVQRAIRKMRDVALSVGLLPLAPLRRIGEVGSSFHCGGTFPMRENPRDLETDNLGRPAGLRRVFLVDSSVFPSIPATTISLSIMANAHRIATAAAQAD
jgi:choline dehydrogenase-like flavoprotein